MRSQAVRNLELRDPSAIAEIPLLRLDWVWLYTPGTLCNLACRHCLTLSSPSSGVLLPLETDEVVAALEEVAAVADDAAVSIGMTGGEVFLLERARYGRRLYDQIALALEVGDVVVLTNGLLATDAALARLKKIEQSAKHTLRFRISLDGPSALQNDSIRLGVGGAATFDRILAALPRFARAGFPPTIAFTFDGEGDPEAVATQLDRVQGQYADLLERAGVPGLELWGLPLFDQGAEHERRKSAGLEHTPSPAITNGCVTRYARDAFGDFQCSYSRAFAKGGDERVGWYKCAVLPAEEIATGSRMATTLVDTLRPVDLAHPSCITCFHAATRGSPMSCSGP